MNVEKTKSLQERKMTGDGIKFPGVPNGKLIYLPLIAIGALLCHNFC